MKWYMGNFNSPKIIKKTDVQELFKDNFKREAPQYANEIIENDFSYAEIYNIKYDCNYETFISEDIIILGDMEIYNIDQLKDKYFKNDNTIKNKDILVELYNLLGIDFIKELNGEYSFVILDKNTKKIYLITDHLGIKPLFWIINRKSLYFATDLFLLKDFFDVRELNKEYFIDYYNFFGQVSNEKTPYKNVYRLEKGTYVAIDIKKNIIQKNKYWDLINLQRPIKLKNKQEYIDKFLCLMKDSVNNRLLKTDKNGVLMSGGIDSTSIYAVAKSVSNKNILPVSAVFDVLSDCDERYYIEQVLDKYNQKGKYVIADEYGTLNGYPEEYFYTYEPYVNFLTFKLTSELVKGASSENVLNLVDGYAGDHLLNGSAVNVIDKIKKLKLIYSFKYIKNIATLENNSFIFTLYKYVIKMINKSKYFADIDLKLYLISKKNINKINTYNQKQLYLQLCNVAGTRYSDREINPRYNMSSKHPFLDKELIEYIYNIPGEFRLNSAQGKYILRKAINGLLPDEIVSRVTKTQHVSLTFKELCKNWSMIYNIAKNFEIGNLGIIDLTKDEWKDQLNKFRCGQTVQENFFVILSLELWLNDYKRYLIK